MSWFQIKHKLFLIYYFSAHFWIFMQEDQSEKNANKLKNKIKLDNSVIPYKYM